MSQKSLIFAISGGVDSCYLLHSLVAQNYQGIVCHVNHQLRPEANADADFVRELARTYELPYEEKVLNLLGDKSFETRARDERLQFFAEVGKKHGIERVALAHHADDQAETILMQLCRGSQEMPGMREISSMDDYGLELWRPLLMIRKSEIINWMKEHGYNWKEDDTNTQAIAVRNRVRNEVLPLLSNIFSRDVTPIIARGKAEDKDALISELIVVAELKDPQGRLFLPKLQRLSLELQIRVLKKYLEEQGIKNLSSDKLKEVVQTLINKSIWKVNLSGGKFLRRKEKRVFVE